jgi:hypothetical protein
MADTIDLTEELALAAEARRKLELDAEYQSLVHGSTPEETQAHWLWYLKERYALDKCPDIYRELQRAPRRNGSLNIYRYMDGRLTAREFHTVIRSDTCDNYAQSLVDNDITSMVFDAVYEDLANTPIYEGLKEFDSLKSGDIRSGVGLAQTCTGSSTLWLQFVEGLHARCGLPTVAELQYKLEKQSAEESVVIKERNFSAFELTAEEIDSYKLLVSDK